MEYARRVIEENKDEKAESTPVKKDNVNIVRTRAMCADSGCVSNYS